MIITWAECNLSKYHRSCNIAWIHLEWVSALVFLNHIVKSWVSLSLTCGIYAMYSFVFMWWIDMDNLSKPRRKNPAETPSLPFSKPPLTRFFRSVGFFRINGWKQRWNRQREVTMHITGGYTIIYLYNLISSFLQAKVSKKSPAKIERRYHHIIIYQKKIPLGYLNISSKKIPWRIL